MNFYEWLQAGIDAGFCTSAYCDTHDAYHEDDWAIINEMEDTDFCWPIVRLRLDDFLKEPAANNE